MVYGEQTVSFNRNGMTSMTASEFSGSAQVGKNASGTEYRIANRYQDPNCNEWYVHGNVKPIKSAMLRLKRVSGDNYAVGKYVVKVNKLLLKFGMSPSNFEGHTASEMFAAANGSEMFSFDLAALNTEYVIDPNIYPSYNLGFMNYLNDSLSMNIESNPWDTYMTNWIGIGFTSPCNEVFSIQSDNFLASGNSSNLGQVGNTLLTITPNSYTVGDAGDKFKPQITTQKDVNGSWVNTNVEYFVTTKSNWITINSNHGYTFNGIANLSFSANARSAGRDRIGYVYVKALFPQGGGVYTNNTDSIKITQSSRQIIGTKNATLITNTPNPFNPTTSISFSLNNPCNIKLSVYDIMGRQIVTLVNGARTAGMHTINFDGSKVASGIYYYTLEANGEIVGKKSMLLVK